MKNQNELVVKEVENQKLCLSVPKFFTPIQFFSKRIFHICRYTKGGGDRVV